MPVKLLPTYKTFQGHTAPQVASGGGGVYEKMTRGNVYRRTNEPKAYTSSMESLFDDSYRLPSMATSTPYTLSTRPPSMSSSRHTLFDRTPSFVSLESLPPPPPPRGRRALEMADTSAITPQASVQ